MSLLVSPASMDLDPETFRQSFDREPFGFSHNLTGLDLFEFESLRSLAARYAGGAFVAQGAPTPGTQFYSVPHGHSNPLEAMDRLESGSYRILLKRPEDRDPRFRELIDVLFRQVVDVLGGLDGAKVVRLQGSILISSATTTTPFHFDPEINFFSQIEGEKIYHVYSPTVLTEAELERFYVRDNINIGQVDFEGRDRSRECVFSLGPGKGLHQPQNAPHWVETRGSRSISYSWVFETDATRAVGRVRGFNYLLRKIGLRPARPGTRPRLESAEAGAMKLVMPIAKTLKNTLTQAVGRPRVAPK
jgi:hypothetical protein